MIAHTQDEPQTPEQVLASVESAVGQRLQGAQVESVGSGVRNALWRITGPNIRWMARIAHHRVALQLDIAQEYCAHRAAAGAGLAPPIIVAVPEQRLLVMEFIPSAPWTRNDLHANIAVLAERVRGLHELPWPPGLGSLNLVDAVMALAARARSDPASKFDIERLESRVGVLAQHYQRGSQSVFCHNDLHHLNILGMPPVFVDWEYAAVGDPNVDLAAIATYHDFDAGQRSELLKCCGSRLKALEFDVICVLFDALHLVWLAAAGAWEQTAAQRRSVLMNRVGLGP